MNTGKEARSLQLQEMETHTEPGGAGGKEMEGEVPSRVCSQEGTDWEVIEKTTAQRSVSNY